MRTTHIHLVYVGWEYQICRWTLGAELPKRQIYLLPYRTTVPRQSVRSPASSGFAAAGAGVTTGKAAGSDGRTRASSQQSSTPDQPIPSMSIVQNQSTEFRSYRRPGIASTMLPSGFAPAGRKPCFWVMSCIIRYRCAVRISVRSTANFRKRVVLRANGSNLMPLNTKRSASLSFRGNFRPLYPPETLWSFIGSSLNRNR